MCGGGGGGGGGGRLPLHLRNPPGASLPPRMLAHDSDFKKAKKKKKKTTEVGLSIINSIMAGLCNNITGYALPNLRH